LGDAVLGAILSALPIEVATALALVTIGLAAAFAVTVLYALGVTWAELRGFFRFLGSGSVLVYAGLHGAAGQALTSAHKGVGDLRARRSEAAAESGPKASTGGIPRFDPSVLRAAGEGMMARIGTAMRNRAEAETAPGLRPTPPLTAAHARPEPDFEMPVIEDE